MYSDEYSVGDIEKKNKKQTNKRDYSRYKKSKYVKNKKGFPDFDELEILKIQNLILCKVCGLVYHNSLTECPTCNS